MPQLQAVHSEVRVWVWPLDPDAAYRTPVALHDSYSGLISPDRGEGGEGSSATGFEALEWQGQQYIKNVSGPMEWVRFVGGDRSGRIERGVRAAAASNPQKELCGWTVRPAFQRVHSTIEDPAKPPGSPDYDLRPRLPQGEPVLHWFTQQGDKWERVIPLRSPQWAGLHHRAAPANRTVKVRSEQWGADEGVSWSLDCDGVAWGHTSEPAIRLEWGNSWSLVFRGIGKTARVQLERKGADKNAQLRWRLIRRFDDASALDEKWWKSRHVVTVYIQAGLLIVEIDGETWWVGQTKKGANNSPTFSPVTWRASPLRVSNFGADVVIQFAKLSFDREVNFDREVPAAAPPSSAVEWECKSDEITRIPLPNETSVTTGISFFDEVINALLAKGKAQMLGTDLERTTINAKWHESENGIGRIDYSVKLRGTREIAPVLMSFAAQFPPTAPAPPPAPVNLRMAMDSLEVESGDPESLPSAQAKLEVSVEMLKRHVPGWEAAILPFRPILIESDVNNDGNWARDFFGYLLPDGGSSDGFNNQHFSITAIDPRIRLREPAALVNERYAPLDLDLHEHGGNLYGGQCFQKLIGYELGSDWAGALNGNGDWSRYLPRNHYPLKSSSGNDYFRSTNQPTKAGFDLVPPFGSDVEKWADTLGEADYAAWFYDPAMGPTEGGRGAFVYGHSNLIFAERGQKIHTLHETTSGIDVTQDDRLSAWPILSAYSAQGLLEKSYTRVAVWGKSPEGSYENYVPSIFTGLATTPLPATDPLSEIASWPRWLLVRQEFIGSMAFDAYAQSLAQTIWREFEGRAPRRFDFTLNDQILPARWGEKLLWRSEELRVLRTKKTWKFGPNAERSTHVTARALSATGL